MRTLTAIAQTDSEAKEIVTEMYDQGFNVVYSSISKSSSIGESLEVTIHYETRKEAFARLSKEYDRVSEQLAKKKNLHPSLDDLNLQAEVLNLGATVEFKEDFYLLIENFSNQDALFQCITSDRMSEEIFALHWERALQIRLMKLKIERDNWK